MTDHDETPLSRVPGLSEATRRRLHDHWITSAEQIVGLASTADGPRTLARALDVDERPARQLIEQCRAALSPEVAASLARPADVSHFGLGATRPRDDS